jgi:hypothetical protein
VTIEEAWDVLDAAGRLAEAHGLELRPVIKPGRLVLELWRAGCVTCWVAIEEAALNACANAQEVTELVEREVAQVLQLRHGERAS